MASVFLLIFIGGQIENQLLSTGAFEVYLNGACYINTFRMHNCGKCVTGY